MKKILQKTNWERYKNSTEGQEVIALFNHLCSEECTIADMLNAIRRFNPGFIQNWSKKEEKWMLDGLGFFDQIISEDIKDDISEWIKADPDLNALIDEERGVMDKLYEKLINDGHPIKNWVYAHYHRHSTQILNEVKFMMLDAVIYEGRDADWCEITK